MLNHTISQEALASYDIPIVAVEGEQQYISGIANDNYMGRVQAASLLVRSECDIFIHISSNLSKYIPAYGRISGFKDFCEENGSTN